MKVAYRMLADGVWALHLIVVAIVLFGWLLPSIFPIYITVLIATLLSEFIWSYCLLSKWEYDLRRKVNSELFYEYSYTSYYTYKLTQGRISPDFLAKVGRIFISFSLLIVLYFRFA